MSANRTLGLSRIKQGIALIQDGLEFMILDDNHTVVVIAQVMKSALSPIYQAYEYLRQEIKRPS